MAELNRAPVFSDEDQATLDRLGRDFRGSLLRYFGRRTRDRVDLEDMVQEVFVRLLRRGETSALKLGQSERLSVRDREQRAQRSATQAPHAPC